MRNRTRTSRVIDALLTRLTKVPPATAEFTRTDNLRVPLRDGTVLLADHLAPVGPAKGTVLVRGPYGFDALGTFVYGGLLAGYGYHVVLVRTRGTFGSGGSFEPFAREVEDGADTVAWLRRQPFFSGRFATFGGSYLGFGQWAMLMDPPPDLATAVMQVVPHDYGRAVHAYGAFNLDAVLSWSDQVAHQDEVSMFGGHIRNLTARRRHGPALSTLPVASAADRLCEGRAPWFADWVRHSDPSEPYWDAMRLGPALDRVQVPVLLQTGWQDLFLDQTLDQYRHLRDRGAEVALTVGPWTHQGSVVQGYQTLIPETLEWLGEHLGSDRTSTRSAPVRVQPGGAGSWTEMASWPPPNRPTMLHLLPGGRLGEEQAPTNTPAVTFTYDPTNPTPGIGGRSLLPATGGYRDDSALARREDVLAFTGSPLSKPVDIAGAPVVALGHLTDNPYADLFVRLSEVDPKGRSRNVCDGFVRLTPGDSGDVRIELDETAYRFATGNRVRLYVAGGCFPRFARNLGTGDDPAHGTRTAPSNRTIYLAASSLTLPVVVED